MGRAGRSILCVAFGAFAGGCLAVRTGDGNEARYGRTSEKVNVVRASAVEPRTAREEGAATVTFFAKGRFTVDAETVVDADDRWMSLGFFPGLKKPGSQVTFWNALLVNCTFFGYPTVGSLLIEPFCDPAGPGEYHIADPGILGCCKYTGERYEVKERRIPLPTAHHELFPLGDFDVEVNGAVRHVPADGRLSLPGARRRERFSVKALGCPRAPEGFAESEAGRAMAGRTFEVECP
ncbi:MAG: hypothetical protein IJ829_00505 [Kiritimatiellae bacterium]|nr:hypothetical protein [Kiritimatiellia bacterium]